MSSKSRYGVRGSTVAVYLPAYIVDQLRGKASQDGVSISEVTRRAFHRYFAPGNLSDTQDADVNHSFPTSSVTRKLETANCAYALPSGCKVAHVLTDAQAEYRTEGDCADAQKAAAGE